MGCFAVTMCGIIGVYIYNGLLAHIILLDVIITARYIVVIELKISHGLILLQYYYSKGIARPVVCYGSCVPNF